MSRITIVQTSDLHNHIDLPKAGRLRNLRVENEALLLDCGDAIWAGNIFVKPGPEHAIRRMNEAGYHAMAMGNREYFFRAVGMLMKTSEAKFPVLCANLLPTTRSLGHVQRWTIVESPQGDRVGVFGLSPLMIPPKSWLESFSDMRFISYERAVREALAGLRGKCDWLVCLSHVGLEQDHFIAERFGQIDVILGGHSHTDIDELIVHNGVAISHVGPYGKAAVVLRSSSEESPSTFERELATLG